MLYQIKNNKIDFSPVQENYTTTQLVDQPYRILVKSEKNSDVLLKRVLKIQVVMDKALFDYMGSEVAIAAEKVVHIFGLINTMFSQLNMTIMLTSLELWSDQNKISLSGDANEVLQRFVSWKEQFLFQRSHDMAYLLIYRDLLNYVGATYHGMACNPKFAAGIALYPQMITLDAFSVVMAQLLGINLGLTYDDIYNCYCPGSTCIMNSEAIRSHGVKYFSSCSMDDFKHMVSQPEIQCLQNQKVSEVVYQGRSAAACGNGILEPPEQCDCGLEGECSHRKCCNPVDCTLIGFAECGSGPCCDRKTCLIAERGRLCRQRTDPCDFPEFCNGTSTSCVPDVKSIDLEPCNNKTAFCFGGVCQDPDVQCEKLFGKFAKVSTYLCTQEVNFQADIFGNCGNTGCSFGSILCGKLVCHWTHSEIVPKSSVHDVQYTYLGGHICLSAHVRNDTTSSAMDLTQMSNGTMCGYNKYCFDGLCEDINNYPNRPNCESEKNCSGHGICNDRLNCHCDVGYSPPICLPSPSSPGGSYNDGFWHPQKKSNTLFRKRHAAPKKNGLLISFYIFIPVLILIAIVALKWNKIRFWNREGSESEESVSEDSKSNSHQSSS
ncbi:A disintegrin and metallopeptidase domain 3-like isoform X3 [Canis lupus baileyi]|nr:A disintegrin and metallopeptidase domain 3-like isoform X6 [Canis lupus familiaris]XP_025291927.1 A disintegrin and metallopeptidase domain 3-like isoform X3 [Canis lupus dingo]XP_038415942.1 A disintegrin and metallopeptidase domain 3-like isoform X4 [Canis lupus familiaris]XP_038545737.1 A disintegrin and metallopeptidase domain 3-like isoform X2 [Canis lupus familiaris]|eukprot:XP_022259731.1 disintegrin and metalloproteinase domain-containing protein 18-like isoform X2 [Canis lupus familiaris]